MKTLLFIVGFILIASLCIFGSGCATDQSAEARRVIQIHYYDQNGDGRVDLEVHHFPQTSDADWELVDTNYDGRYDVKTLIGFAIQTTAVDIPVPTGVKIEKKP